MTKYHKVIMNCNEWTEDGPEKVNDFMEGCKKTLDECCYGLNDAKMQIMQLIGQWVSNPAAVGNAIAIKGPPGTGKTTLVKNKESFDILTSLLNKITDNNYLPKSGCSTGSYFFNHIGQVV